MDLDLLMTEIGTALDTITGLRIAKVGEKPIPPAAYVAYPSEIVYDATYGRGSDTMALEVVVVVGKTVDRTARKHIAAYCNGSGSASIKATLDGYAWTKCDSLRVSKVEFDVVSIAAVDHMAAIFSIDITGSGA